jgi:putative hydrolases of HD superfamily
MPKTDYKKITNFIFELNHLKKQRHTGMQFAGVKNPESVAEHVWRAAQIGYILAELEGDVDSEKVAAIVLIHDNGEIRIGDQHKIASRYFSTDKAEENSFLDQIKNLSEQTEAKWKDYFNQFENRNTKEGIIAKDADWLEQAFEAKEQVDLGYPIAQAWIDHVEKALETKSAKKLLAEMKKTNFADWWVGLEKMTYKKLDK